MELKNTKRYAKKRRTLLTERAPKDHVTPTKINIPIACFIRGLIVLRSLPRELSGLELSFCIIMPNTIRLRKMMQMTGAKKDAKNEIPLTRQLN